MFRTEVRVYEELKMEKVKKTEMEWRESVEMNLLEFECTFNK